ncbi:hypothetical protein BKA62DRAFT_719909 [Auriculariales sp. MPI-PUGE-AT-0066]|nr:hypothetical protein BKA62DRAFT_719909 [Auriculariales sp. MPI-PUGE-AT-0066]
MAPPVLYVVGGVVIAVGAVIAFKELIYEPFIHPHVEAYWERRHGRRMAPAHETHTLPRATSSGVNRDRDHEHDRDRETDGRGDVELTGMRHRRLGLTDQDIHDDSGQSSARRTRSHPRFGLYTPSDSLQAASPNQTRRPGPAEALLVDVDLKPEPIATTTTNPFAHADDDDDADESASPSLLRRRSTATSGAEMTNLSVRTRTTRVSTTPSLLHTPPGQHSRPSAPMPSILRPTAPVRAPTSEDDDDMVLSFTGTRPSLSHQDSHLDIAMPQPRPQPQRQTLGSGGVAEGSPFVIDSDHEHDMRSVSSASASAFDAVSQPSSRAMSPFVFDGDNDEPDTAHPLSPQQFHLHPHPHTGSSGGRVSVPMSSPPTYASRASPAGAATHSLAQAFLPPLPPSTHFSSPTPVPVATSPHTPRSPLSPRSPRSDGEGWSDALVSPTAPTRVPLHDNDTGASDFDFGDDVSVPDVDADTINRDPDIGLAHTVSHLDPLDLVSPTTESSVQSAFSRGISHSHSRPHSHFHSRPTSGLDVLATATASAAGTRPVSVLDILASAASVHSDVEADDESPVPGAGLVSAAGAGVVGGGGAGVGAGVGGGGRRRVVRLKPRLGRGGGGDL